MSRVALILTAAAAAMGPVLAGCSDSSSSLPQGLTPKQSAPAPQTLHFQSDPPGANVRTANGQTCQTPCSLAVSSESQSITFEKDGFTPQTIQVAVGANGAFSFLKRPAACLESQSGGRGAASGPQTDKKARRTQGCGPHFSSADAKFAGA